MTTNTNPNAKRKPFYPTNPAEEIASVLLAIYRREKAREAREAAEREQTATTQEKATAG